MITKRHFNDSGLKTKRFGRTQRGIWRTVGSHDFKLQNLELRVSNPRTIAYVHFKQPFYNLNLPGPGHIFPD